MVRPPDTPCLLNALVRPLTAEDRRPRKGDMLRYYTGSVIEIDEVGPIFAVVSTPRGLTRIGWSWIEGGWHCWIANSPHSPTGWAYIKPSVYLKRRDGGSITHPLDAGAFV